MCPQLSCIVPQLGGVVPVLFEVLVGLVDDGLYVGFHPVGQEHVALGVCDGVVEELDTLFVVHLGDVDAAVVEVAAPVLLDVGGDDVLAYVEVLGGDVNLYGILAAGPAYVLLQQVAVDVCLVNVVVADVELVGETVVDLVELEVAANPVVGAVAGFFEDAAWPDALLLGHVAFAAGGHHLVVPHGVVEISLCPGQCLDATADFGSN